MIAQRHRHPIAAGGLRDEGHHRAHGALIGERQPWLKEAGQRLIIKLHAEADRRRDLDLRRGGVTGARTDEIDSSDLPVGHNRRRGGGDATGWRRDCHHGRAEVTATPRSLIEHDHRDASAAHAGRGAGAGPGVGTAVGPVVALAILEGEGAVTRRRIEPAGRIGHAVHFVV